MGKRESKEKGGEETQVKRKKRNKWWKRNGVEGEIERCTNNKERKVKRKRKLQVW